MWVNFIGTRLHETTMNPSRRHLLKPLLSNSSSLHRSSVQQRSIQSSLTWISEDMKYKSPYSKQSITRPPKMDWKEELHEERGGLKKRISQHEKRRHLVKEEIENTNSDSSLLTVDDMVRTQLYRDLEGIDQKDVVPGNISQLQYLQNIVPKFVHEVIKDKGHIYLKTSNRYLPLLQKFLFLHMNTQVKICSDITAIDYLYSKRFQLIYNLKSSVYNQQYFLKLWVSSEDFVMSSKELYPSALWYEREAFDMFGVQFMGERETRRLLTDYGFKGHPLRKDFPLSGFTEVFYDSRVEELAYKPVSLVQKYRFYNRPSPWTSKRGLQSYTRYDAKLAAEHAEA